jgi:hypothetical protein
LEKFLNFSSNRNFVFLLFFAGANSDGAAGAGIARDVEQLEIEQLEMKYLEMA